MIMNTPAARPDGQGPDIKIFVNGRLLLVRPGVSVMAALIAGGYSIGHHAQLPAAQWHIFCGMGTCCECRVTINGLPDRRSCMTAVEENMEIVLDQQ